MPVDKANLHYAYSAVESGYEHRLLSFAQKDLTRLGYKGTIQIDSNGHIVDKDGKLSYFINYTLRPGQITNCIRELKKYLRPPTPPAVAPRKTFEITTLEQAQNAKYDIYAEFKDPNNPEDSTFRVVMPDGNYYEVKKANLVEVLTPLDAFQREEASKVSYEAMGSMSAEAIASVISHREDSWTVLSHLLTADRKLGMAVFHNITPESQQNFVTWLVGNKRLDICKFMIGEYMQDFIKGPEHEKGAMHNMGSYFGYMDKADRALALSTFKNLFPSIKDAMLTEYYDKALTFQVYGYNGLLNNTSFFYLLLKEGYPQVAAKLVEHHKEVLRNEPKMSFSREFFEKTFPDTWRQYISGISSVSGT